MTTPTITRLKLPAVRRAVEATQWAIQREKLLAMLEVLEVHATGGAFSAADIQARTQARVGDRKPVTKSGGAIAVLPLYGVVSQRMSLMAEFSGGTSTERFADEFDAAMANPDVSAIVIDCDSPGGNVQGTPELAKRIYNARGKGKQIVAVANSTMASAAYWICSAADEIVTTPSGDVGSIGVFCVHLDESGLNEQLGLSYTLISAGEHKTDGNPFEPLSDDARAFVQSQIDEMYGMFVSAVAKHRGVKASVVKAQYGQGRCLTATQALEAGMIDRIATLEETLKRLGARDVGMSGKPRAHAAVIAASAAQASADMPTDMPTDVPTDVPEMAPDPAEEPDDDGDEMCPDCGAPMDGERCSSCDYTRPMTEATDAGAERAATEPEEISARADGAAAANGSVTPSTNRPHGPEDSTMPDNGTVPAGADLNAAIAAERKRASSIRALAKKHRIDDAQADAMINDGLTVDQAATRVLSLVEARVAASPTIAVGADREADRPFANVGEQLFAIVQRSKTGRRDARLDRVNYHAMQIDRVGALDMMAGAPDGMNESVGSEGGFFIAPEVLPGVIEPVYENDPILSRVKRIPIGTGTNRVVYNVVDESARTDGSRWGGIQMYWGDEADTATAKKPKMRQVEQVLKKIIGAAYLTDELVQDAPASQTLLTDAFTSELQFMLASGIFRGPGGGQMLGFLKGKGGVSQAIEGGQTIANSAASLSQNVTKMKANIPASLWPDLVWLYNQELLPYLMNATVGGVAIPVFVPAGGYGNAGSVDRILGAPAFASEQCEQPGTVGDILCIAPSQYHVAEKGGAQIATSIHVKFLNDELTLRMTYRVDGKPVWNTTVTPYKGSTARGFFSTLAARV